MATCEDSTVNSAADLGNKARNLLRDFPVFFEESYTPLTTPTIRLQHPLVTELVMRSVEDGGMDDGFILDRRNGVVQIKDPASLEPGVSFSGYHYEWFLEEDLEFFSEMIMTELANNRPEFSTWSSFSPVQLNVAAMGTVVYALFSLMTDLSTDIDVSTPEGMMIPAHMRFQQVMQMYQFWKAQYAEKAAMLNIGLEAIEIGVLRRVSWTTGRLVPIFRDREVDDPRPPVRVFPDIPAIVSGPEEGGSQGSVGFNPDYGIAADGWETIGTSGSW